MQARVTPHHVWRHPSGASCSFYGAAPHGAGWEAKAEGFAVWSHDTVIRSHADKAKAEADAARLNAKAAADRAEHVAAWAPVMAPIQWSRSKGNDGVTRHHSGERYSIVSDGGLYAVECDGALEELSAFRTLAKAKAWCERMIRSERQEATFS